MQASDEAADKWRDDLKVGDKIDFYNRAWEVWVPAEITAYLDARGFQVAVLDSGRGPAANPSSAAASSAATGSSPGTSASSGAGAGTAGGVASASAMWFSKDSRFIARSGSYVTSEDDRLAREPWRSQLRVGDIVDAVMGNRWVPATVEEVSHQATPPEDSFVMSSNPLVLPGAGESTSTGGAVEVGSAVTPPSADAGAGADSGERSYFVRLRSASSSWTEWTSVASARIARFELMTRRDKSFGMSDIRSLSVAARLMPHFNPTGGPIDDADDPVLGDGSLAAALAASPADIVRVRGPGRVCGGTHLASLLQRYLASGGLRRLLARIAHASRRAEDLRRAEAAATAWRDITTRILAGPDAPAAGMLCVAIPDDQWYRALDVVAEAVAVAVGAPEEGDSDLPEPETIVGVLRILTRGYFALNVHWTRTVIPVLVLMCVRALACYPDAPRRQVHLETVRAIGDSARNLLQRAYGLRPAVALLEWCSLMVAETLLQQDLLQQRITGMKFVVEAATAAAGNEAAAINMPTFMTWLAAAGVMDTVFSRSGSHVELYRRVGGVVQALLRAGCGGTDLLDRFWEHGRGLRADEEHRQLCFSQLQDMARDILPEHSAHVLVKLGEMNPATFHPDGIKLVVALLSVIPEKAARVGPVGLNVLWGLAVDSSQRVRSVLTAKPRTVIDIPPRGSSDAAFAAYRDAIRAAKIADREQAILDAAAPVVGGAVGTEEGAASRGPASAEIRRQARERLTSLLQMYSHERMKIPFCVKALSMLARREQCTSMLQLLWRVVEDFPSGVGSLRETNRSEVVEYLNSEHRLIPIIVEDIERLHMDAKECARTSGWLPTSASPTADERRSLGSLICAWVPATEGGADYLTALRERVQLLYRVCASSPHIVLGADEARRLWGLLVSDSLCPQESEVFVRQLRMAVTGDDSFDTVEFMKADTIEALFTGCMLLEDPAKVQLAEFITVGSFFLAVNGRHCAVDLRPRRMGEAGDPDFAVRVSPDRMLGFDYLWRIALEAVDDEVGARSIEVLSSLHSQFSPAFEAEAGVKPEALRASFVTSLVRDLRSAVASKKWAVASRCLVALERVLQEADEAGVDEIRLRPHGAITARASRLQIRVINNIASREFDGRKAAPPARIQLTLSSGASVWELRCAIAEQLGVEARRLKMIRSGQEILIAKNGLTLTEAGFQTSSGGASAGAAGGGAGARKSEAADSASSPVVYVTLTAETTFTAPLLANPNVRDASSARMTPACERMFTDVFNRFAIDGGLDKDGFRTYCRACNVKDENNLSDSRLNEVFALHDRDERGCMTLKGFLQFYTEACKGRASAVYSDIEELGHDKATLLPRPGVRPASRESPTLVIDSSLESSDPKERAASQEREEGIRRDQARAVRAMSRSLLASADVGTHDALFDALAAPQDYDEAVTSRAWRLLMRLPSLASILARVGAGLEDALFEQTAVQDAPRENTDTAPTSESSDVASHGGAAITPGVSSSSSSSSSSTSSSSSSSSSSSTLPATLSSVRSGSTGEPAPEGAAPDSAASVVVADLTSTDWSKLLDASSPFRLLYVLQLIEAMSISSSARSIRGENAGGDTSVDSSGGATTTTGSSAGTEYETGGAMIGPATREEAEGGALSGADDGIRVRNDDGVLVDQQGDPLAVDSGDEPGATGGDVDSGNGGAAGGAVAAAASAPKVASAPVEVEPPRFAAWREAFIRSGGVGHLLSLLSSTDTESLSTVTRAGVSVTSSPTVGDSLRRQCVAQLMMFARAFIVPALEARAEVGFGSVGSADEADVAHDTPSLRSASALVRQMAGPLGEEVLAAADPPALLRKVVAVIGAAAMAGTDPDVTIVGDGLQLMMAIAAQRPLLLAEMLRDEIAVSSIVDEGASGMNGPFARVVVSLLLHDKSVRFRRLASSILGSMVSMIPDRLLHSAGLPSLADFLLTLLLDKLDEVAEAAEAAIAAAGDVAPSGTGTDASGVAACVQYFSLLTRVLEHISKDAGSSLGSAPADDGDEDADAESASDAAAGASGELGSRPALRRSASRQAALQERLRPVAVSLMRRIAAHAPLERRDGSEQVDQLLTGVMRTLATLAQTMPDLRALSSQWGTGVPGREDDTFLRVVFEDCLFFQPTRAEDLDESTGPGLPKCKRPKTRAAAFALLAALVKESATNLSCVSDLLLPIMDAQREDGAGASSTVSTGDRRAKSGYVGLVNLGCICYMNSVVQQLFMVPQFRFGILAASCAVTDDDDDDGHRDIPNDVRDAVLRWEAAPQREKPTDMAPPASDSILFQMQRMFASLSMSMRRDYNPRPLCTAFRDSSGKPVDVRIQQDAEEFVNRLLDRLDAQLKGTPQAGLVRECFTGTMVDQMCCPEFDWMTERRTQFTLLPVDVKNNSNVYQAMQRTIQPDIISDFRCEAAPGTPTDLYKRAVLGHLPDTLVMQFKRFQFNFDTFEQEKLNSRLEFPHELDLYAFTREGVAAAEKLDAAAGSDGSPFFSAFEALERRRMGLSTPEAAEGAASPDVADAAASTEPDVLRYEDGRLRSPSDDYIYDLAGIVVHTGTAQMGHYYSFIRDRATGKWFEFNDSRVEAFDPANIPEMCFGGTGTSTGVSRWGYQMQYETERSLNAYLALYQRRAPSRSRAAVAVTAVLHGLTTPPTGADVSPDALPARRFDPIARAEALEAELAKEIDGDKRTEKQLELQNAEAAADAGLADFSRDLFHVAERARSEAAAAGGRVSQVRVLRDLLPTRQFNRVFQANARFMRQQELFSPEFFGFIASLFRGAAPPLLASLRLHAAGDSTHADLSTDDVMRLVRTGIEFTLRVMARSKEDKHVAAVISALSPILRECPSACTDLLSMLVADSALLSEVLLKCTNKNTRIAVRDLIAVCLEVVAQQEAGALWIAERADLASQGVRLAAVSSGPKSPVADVPTSKAVDAPLPPSSGAGAGGAASSSPPGASVDGVASPESPESTLRKYLLAHLALLPQVDKHWARFEQYWGVLLDAARLGSPVRRWLVHKRLIDIIVDFVEGERSSIKDRVRPDGRKIQTMGSTHNPGDWVNLTSLLSLLVRSVRVSPVVRLGTGARSSVARAWRAAHALGDMDVARASSSRARPPVSVYSTPSPLELADAFAIPLNALGEPDESMVEAAEAALVADHMMTSEEVAPFVEPLPVLHATEFLISALSFGKAFGPEAITELITHLSWENIDFTCTMCEALIKGVAGVSYAGEAQAVLGAIRAVLLIDDSLRGRRVQQLLGDPYFDSFKGGVVLGFPPEPLPAAFRAAEGEAVPAEATPAVSEDSAPAPSRAERVTAEATATMAGVTRMLLHSRANGAGPGILGWMLKNSDSKRPVVAMLLSWLLDVLEAVPEARRWVVARLPPLAPSRHSTFADWLIEWARWHAHSSTIGSPLPDIRDRRAAIALYKRTRSLLRGFAAELGVEQRFVPSAEFEAEDDALLESDQLVQTFARNLTVATVVYTHPDGEQRFGVRFVSAVKTVVRWELTIECNTDKPDEQPNFAMAPPEEQPQQFLVRPLQCGVVNSSRRLRPAQISWGEYKYSWKYHFTDGEGSTATPTGCELVAEQPVWVDDAEERAAQAAADKMLIAMTVSSSGMRGSAGTTTGSGSDDASRRTHPQRLVETDATWQERDQERDPRERLFDVLPASLYGSIVELAITPFVGGGSWMCGSCGSQNPSNEIKCLSCRAMKGDADDMD